MTIFYRKKKEFPERNLKIILACYDEEENENWNAETLFVTNTF